MKKFLLFVAIFYSSASFASSANNVTISLLHFLATGEVIFYTSTAHSGNVPACAASNQTRYVVSGTTAGGKVQLAGLLAAYISNKTVSIVGKDVCDVYADTESVQWFYIVN